MITITTEHVVAGATLALLAWEAWTLVNKTPRDTISEVVWRASDQAPPLVLAAGIVIGHWFWPRRIEGEK